MAVRAPGWALQLPGVPRRPPEGDMPPLWRSRSLSGPWTERRTSPRCALLACAQVRVTGNTCMRIPRVLGAGMRRWAFTSLLSFRAFPYLEKEFWRGPRSGHQPPLIEP